MEQIESLKIDTYKHGLLILDQDTMHKVFSRILWLVLFCWHCLSQGEGLNGAEISGHPY